ncbi:restriction endonuclease subunit S [Bradyrhizobium japonicum]|uniref:restriction endonuclease subunit S n=1 Tax=Bradyrhizobium japonicum TaxID=375 RepID=UPI000676016E|nr:restriction endonuclease subunit S [Bradyrhizobium japonicum]
MSDAWDTKPLGQIITLQRGFDLPTQSRSDGEIAVIGSNGVVGFHNSAPTNLPIPGLMLGRSGSVGEITFWDQSYWPLNTVLYVKDFHGNDPRFLSFWLRLFPFKQYAEGVSVPTLNRNSIYDVPFPLPKFDDQLKISAVLAAVEMTINFNSMALLKSRELKRVAMRELFTKGLRGEPQIETEFGPAPETWQSTALNICATVQTGVAKGRKFADAEMVDVPYLRVANVQDGHLDLSEMKEIHIRRSEVERYRLQTGDVVLTEGGDFDKLGRGFIWRGELDLCVHQNHVFAVRPDRTRLLPEFFAYLAQSAYGKAYFLKVAHKTTNLACINSTKLKAFPVLIPPTLDEQREIVEILDAIDRKIGLHQRKRLVLEELFKTLLHKLMTGEIRIANLDLTALTNAPLEGVAA